jgi:hypothetical protein
VAARARDSEKQWTWGAWLTLAAALGWTSIFFISLIALSQPTDGWTHLGPRRGTGAYELEANLSGKPSVLQPGDVLVGINGQMLAPDVAPPFPPDLREGQTLRYVIQRGSETLKLEVPMVRPGMAGLLRSVASRWQATPRDFLVSTISLLVVALAFLLRPGNLGARYLLLIFSFYCLGTWFAFATSTLYAFSFPLPWSMAYALAGPQVWAWYFFPSITLMALAFPVVKYPLRRFPRLLPTLLYSVPLVLAILMSFSEYHWHDYRLTRLLSPFFIFISLLTIVTLFGTLIHNWFTIREPIARAQLRWLGVGLGLGLGLMFALILLAITLYGSVPPNWNDILWLPILLPISMAIAITRYRLFEIDLIIRRTLVYSVLTGLLALAYLGSILILQNLFQALTVQGQDQLVTVISTLGIAALFVPLRSRVQAFIDRRFFRRKYDAARILAEFATSARDDVNLADLKGQLMSVVDVTLQPASVDIWLRGPEAT